MTHLVFLLFLLLVSVADLMLREALKATHFFLESGEYNFDFGDLFLADIFDFSYAMINGV